MGLVEYGSSDESDNEKDVRSTAEKGQEVKDEVKAVESRPEEKVLIGPITQNAVQLGPCLPPLETTQEEEITQNDDGQSSYSSARALIHDLTLPSVPNLDIPPSPPGSPPPGANAKLKQFLDLKRKGTHFNAKLEQSTALRNPGLMDKLLAYVEIDEAAQYETTLSSDLWDPTQLPEWAFRDRLRKSRERIAKRKEAERASGGRTSVEFVSAHTPSATTSAGGLMRSEKKGWK